MAGRPLTADQIRTILELYQKGLPRRVIARSLDPPVGKATVDRHVNFIRNNNLEVQYLLDMSDRELDNVFHKGNPAYTDPRMGDFIDDIIFFENECRDEDMTVSRMWENYRERCLERGKEYYSFTQFKYHLMQAGLLPQAKIKVAIPEVRGGREAIVTARAFETSHVDRETGEQKIAYIIVLYMVSSEYISTHNVESLDIREVVSALNSMFLTIWGVTRVLDVSDLVKICYKPADMKPSVKSILKEMLAYYGMVGYIWDAETIAREHLEKALNHLNHMMPKKECRTLSDVFEMERLFLQRYNRTRIRGRQLSREEDFLRNERPGLRSLPKAPFQAGEISGHKVHTDGTIQVGRDKDTGYYSVPALYIGRKVRCIRGDNKLLILGPYGLIASHAPVGNHRYSLEEEHIREWEASSYNDLTPFAARLFNISPSIAYWVKRFFERLLCKRLHIQECVRKYENIERMAHENPGLLRGFCEMYPDADFDSYRDFICAYNGYRQCSARGAEFGRRLSNQK